jgi:cell division cycle protein 37
MIYIPSTHMQHFHHATLATPVVDTFEPPNMPLDYSKWDALELSDDSDIEVHPNVDKKSFIRAKQAQIHQERAHRKQQIETLKYERIINDGLLSRIDGLLNSLKAHSSSTSNPDQLVFQALIESADPENDQPPAPPAGVHTNVQDQPAYSKMRRKEQTGWLVMLQKLASTKITS